MPHLNHYSFVDQSYYSPFLSSSESFESKVFEKQRIKLGGTEEDIVKGGRDLFSLLPKAFEGIEKIGVRIFKTYLRGKKTAIVYPSISM